MMAGFNKNFYTSDYLNFFSVKVSTLGRFRGASTPPLRGGWEGL